MVNKIEFQEVVLKTKVDNLDLVPSHMRLDRAEQQLIPEMFKESRLHKEIRNLDYGFIVIDCRPIFKEKMTLARQRKFDILLVWKLDRLSRSLKDLINTLDKLGHLDIDFISYDNKLNTSSPTGKLSYQIIGAVAEFERDIISERVKADL